MTINVLNMTFDKSYLKYNAPALAWGIFIFILSTLPGKDLPHLDWGDWLSVDKWVHFTFYAVFAALILWSKRLDTEGGALWRLRQSVVFAALVSVGYGWLIEAYQHYFCVGRLFETADGLANSLGALSASVAFYVYKRRQWRQHF